MLGAFTAILSRLNPVAEETAPTTSEPRQASSPDGEEDSTYLFECDSCGDVYIAEEKQRCADCEAGVARVQGK